MSVKNNLARKRHSQFLISWTCIRKIPAPMKIKLALPPPNRGISWGGMGVFQQKEPKIPGAHKIGAAISGPRIAGGNNCGHWDFLDPTWTSFIEKLQNEPLHRAKANDQQEKCCQIHFKTVAMKPSKPEHYSQNQSSMFPEMMLLTSNALKTSFFPERHDIEVTILGQHIRLSAARACPANLNPRTTIKFRDAKKRGE